ncbi:hypothetical protein [Chitinilyticum aquatile]|uniref:hypothetical protein n=1 Tax=Chitinilyticum aquatile TaxID=362520 RepID=UPI00041B9E7C|nr:hypothetical protein [Chitinilyticum aquatile]
MSTLARGLLKAYCRAIAAADKESTMYRPDPFLRLLLILLGLRHVPQASPDRIPRPFFPDYLRDSDIPAYLSNATLAWREEFAPLPQRPR